MKLCENGCGKTATHITLKGKHVCGKKAAQCPSVLKKMQATTLLNHGVTNISSSKKTKATKKKKALAKYGVDNVSKASAVKTVIAQKATKRWEEIYDGKNFTIDGLTRSQYRHRCQQYANTQYAKFRKQLDPDNKRGRNAYHLDHIYSVTDGFLNDVPVNILSDISNLRLISDKDNYKKHQKSEKSLNQLYEDYLLASSS